MDREEPETKRPGLVVDLLDRYTWVERQHASYCRRTGAQEIVTLDHIEWRRTVHLLPSEDDALWDVATRYHGKRHLMPHLVMRGDPGLELHFRVVICPRRYAEHETQPSDSDEEPPNE